MGRAQFTRREKCTNTEVFLVVIFPDSDWIQKNSDQKNSVFGYFSRSVNVEFCDTHNLKSLIREPTCYKNSENPSYIDLILTNGLCSFQNSCVFETGLSDFHMTTITTTKIHFQQLQPKVINCRDYKHFQNENFREDLLFELPKLNVRNKDDGLIGKPTCTL